MPPPTFKPSIANPGGSSSFSADGILQTLGGALNLYGQYEAIRRGGSTQTAPAPNAPAPAGSSSIDNAINRLYNLIPEPVRAGMVRNARTDAINISLADAQTAAKDNIGYIAGIAAAIVGGTYVFMKVIKK